MIDTVSTWSNTLEQLKNQLTASIYNAWLRGATARSDDGENWTIYANRYAVAWMETQLFRPIHQALSEQAGRPVTIVFEIKESQPQQHPLLPDAAPPPPDIELPDFTFPGFEIPKANFLQVPNELIDQVFPYVRPSIVILVITTMRQTIGTIEGYGKSRPEWPTNHAHTRRLCNFGKATVYTAIWEARAMGLLVQRIPANDELPDLRRQAKIKVVYTLRPRWLDEPIDYPTTPKPRR